MSEKSHDERLLALEKGLRYVTQVFQALPGLGRILGNLTTTGNLSVAGTASITGDTTITGRLSSASDDGWIRDTATWTYASATTFTVSGDATARFGKGKCLKLTQTTVKYFYVVSAAYAAPNTTVTVTGGSDYSLANAAITDTYYSFMRPADFTDWFNYTPAWTGSGSNPVINNGTLLGRFQIVGRKVTAIVAITMGAGTTYGTGNYSFSLPVNAKNTATYQAIGDAYALDSGTTIRIGKTVGGVGNNLFNAQSDNTLSVWGQTVPFTWAVNDRMRFTHVYEMD